MREHHDNRALELVAFGALAAFAAAHWVTLVADPPVGRALLAALAACAGGVVLARLGALRLPRGGSWALAGAVAAATLALGLLALGLRAGLLAPGGWGELADGIGQGLDGLADADYPYSGQNPWTRLTILLVLPLALGAAAALAFWPGRRQRGGMALLVLIALYAVAVTVRPPPLTLLWGAVLLALIAAWLWLPRLERSSAAAALAALATACVVGLGAAVVLDGDDPWIDWTELALARRPAQGGFPLEPQLRADRLAARGHRPAAGRERRPALLADDCAGPLRRLPLGGGDRDLQHLQPLGASRAGRGPPRKAAQPGLDRAGDVHRRRPG